MATPRPCRCSASHRGGATRSLRKDFTRPLRDRLRRSHATLSVVVRNLAGNCIGEFTADSRILYSNLLEKVALLEGLPPSFLALSLGPSYLSRSDRRPLRGRRPGTAALEVTSVMLLTPLREADHSGRCAALQELAGVARRGDLRIVTAVSRLAEDADADVRCTALQALAKVCDHGCVAGLASVYGRLLDEDLDVIKAALGVLGDLAPHGDARAIASAQRALKEHPSSLVRVAGAVALALLAEHGTAREEALAALRWFAADPSNSVRDATAEALGLIAQRGDERALAALRRLAQDECAGIRCTVLSVLRKVCRPGCPEGLAAARVALSDPSKVVQVAAAKALVILLAEHGNEREAALGMLRRYAKDSRHLEPA